jgi:sarcosine oxidase
MQRFDAIVVGLGAHGSATAAVLARRGLRILGLERFGRGETFGSSGGRSRMIRLAYFEDPSYVPLARASWHGWEALEAETGTSLLTRTGGLYAGPADSSVVAGSVHSAREHDLVHEVLDAAEIHRRWPVFRPSLDTVGLWEERAGVIRADLANEAHLRVAERGGATLRFGARVVGWRPVDGGGFEVETDDGSVAGAACLVLTAGPWTSALVPSLRLPLVVERQPVLWFEPTIDPAELSGERLPVWLMATGDGVFYGFPYDPSLGLKVSLHHTGVFVDPDDAGREVTDADEARVRGFIRSRMPAVDGRLRTSTVCLYTNAPDDHFVIDRHPAADGVAFASACSGHGYKYSPLIGEILADLATTGSTRWPIDGFRSGRFGGPQIA